MAKFAPSGSELVESEVTVISTTYEMSVARGLLDGQSSVHKFGANPSIASATPETVWDVGGTVAFNTSNQSIEILGGTNDDVGGTGALTVYVEGQNYAGTVQTEVVVMTGVTPVVLADTYSHVYRAYVVTAGGVGTNDADIVIRVASAGATQATILAGLGQTQMAVFRIPAGKTGYLQQWDCRITKKQSATVEFILWTRPFGGAWRVQDDSTTISSGTSSTVLNYSPPRVLSARSEIYVQADSDTNGTSVGSSFDIILIDD